MHKLNIEVYLDGVPAGNEELAASAFAEGLRSIGGTVLQAMEGYPGPGQVVGADVKTIEVATAEEAAPYQE